MKANYDINVESHRNWKDSFGFEEEDVVNDMNAGDWITDKNVPVCEVSVPACSYTEVIAEYINPVNGDELGEQTVTYNVAAHDGLYYFSTKEKYNTFVNTIIPGLSAQVEEPTGTRVKLDIPELEDIPSVYIY